MKTCPLCGNKFTRDGQSHCAACPMGAGCNTACCPRCGYKFVESSKTIDFIMGLLGRSK